MGHWLEFGRVLCRARRGHPGVPPGPGVLRTLRRTLSSLVLIGALAVGCARPPQPGVRRTRGTLRAAFEGAFLVGAALNAAQFSGRDTLGAALVRAQFNAITPENVLKWASVHPRLGTSDFTAADQYVAFGERHRMIIVRRPLVWRQHAPRRVG